MSKEHDSGRAPSADELRRADLVQQLPPDQQRRHPSAIPVDASKLDHINTYGSLPGYYLDLPFRCRRCGVAQIWKARDQKWYYEQAKGHIDATAVHCHDCRQAAKKVPRTRRE